MTDTVFWSWQNDLPAKSNRAFIRDVLAVAVDRVSQTLDVEDVERIALDHDTKATAGMADISQTILEKIARSAVMVADVTPIARTENGKALPNPNVMVELGYALSAIGYEKIIAVLNTAYGDKVENLPFDIRHRRILTYSLSADAPKSERSAVREGLIKQLTEAIRFNIERVRDVRSASEPISGVESDPTSPGLWKAQWPVTHTDGFGEVARVRPLELSRAWIRIIPAGFPNGQPSITELDRLPDSARLWAPTGAGSGGNFGSCPFGFVTYWVAGRDDDGTCRSRNIAAYLEESGEVWMSDGVAFTQDQQEKYISYARLFSNWIRGMDSGMACLDALGASTRRRIIIGIDGLSDAVWAVQSGYVPARSRKERLLIDETDRIWSQERRLKFLRGAWNTLRDAFSIRPMNDEEFSQYYEVRKRS